MEKILNKINLTAGAVITLMSAVFGTYWYLFAAFLALNIVDYITGILKARYTNTENSNRGWRGIVKKTGYWVVIAIAFFIAQFFDEMGALINADLGFTVILGWMTLATFIINEMRSILENLVVMNVEVPKWLIEGLEITKNKLLEVGDNENN